MEKRGSGAEGETGDGEGLLPQRKQPKGCVPCRRLRGN